MAEDWASMKQRAVDALISPANPSQGELKRAHEGSQSSSPSKDANQPVSLNRSKTILPGQEGSTPPGFKGYQ